MYSTKIKKVLNSQFLVFLVSNYFVAVTAMLSTFAVAKILEEEDFGKVRLFVAVVATVNVFCTLSFNAVFLKVSSGNPDREYTEKLYLSMINVVMYLTLIVVSALIAVEFVINNYSLRIFSVLFFLTIIPMTINLMQLSVLQSNNQFIIISKLQAYAKIISAVLLIMLSYTLGVTGYAIANLLGVSLLFVLFQREIGKKKINNYIIFFREINEHIGVVKSSWKISKYLFSYQIVRKFNLYADFFIVGIFLSGEEIGSFALALAFISALDVMVSTVQQKAAPALSSKINSGSEWQNIARKYHLTNIVLVCISSLGAYFIFPLTVDFFYGGKFTSFNKVFMLLLAAWAIRSFFAVDRVTLTSLGRTKDICKIYAIPLPFNIIFSVFLIKNYGVDGAGIGAILSSIISGYLFTYYKKSESVDGKIIF